MDIIIHNIDNDDIIKTLHYITYIPKIGECISLYVDDQFKLFRIANVVHSYASCNIIEFIRLYVYKDR